MVGVNPVSGDEDRSDKKIHSDIDESKVERAENEFDIFMRYMPQRKSSRDDADKMEIKSKKPEYGDEFIRGQIQYWRQVNESEGFDIECVSVPQGTNYGLLSYDCLRQDARIPNSLLVNLYARLGLHRYNFSKGTNLQLVQLTKFNVSMGCLSTYYITMVAHDPRTTETLTFQVKVGENSYGRLDVTCYIARPKGTLKESSKPIDFGPTKGGLPYWPSDFSDTQRFYVMKESELQDNNDWVRLYLELALCTNDRWIPHSALSQLQIVEVAVEAIGDVVEPLSERFEEKNASSYVYIKFKGLAMARVGEIGAHIERKVIVRRLIDDLTGRLSLLGGFGFSCGEEVVERPMTRPTFDFDAKQELCNNLRQRRKKDREAVTEDDCLRAISKLKVLGSGFEVITVGKKKLVRSVPTELNKDHNQILELAHQGQGFVTVEEVQGRLSWTSGRVIDALKTLLEEDWRVLR